MHDISRLAGIDIRILPLGGDHAVVSGAFNYFRFREIHGSRLPDKARYEHLTSTSEVVAEDEAHQYKVAFDALHAAALDQDASRSLITRAAADWAGSVGPVN